MEKQILINVVGIVFIFTGILDALKYWIQASKIKHQKTAKTISRQFLNYAILNDLIKLLYGILIWDAYITSTSVLALFTMIYMWRQVYLYYPYKQRGLTNFHRPNVFVYIINSLLPNNLRKRL